MKNPEPGDIVFLRTGKYENQPAEILDVLDRTYSWQSKMQYRVRNSDGTFTQKITSYKRRFGITWPDWESYDKWVQENTKRTSIDWMGTVMEPGSWVITTRDGCNYLGQIEQITDDLDYSNNREQAIVRTQLQVSVDYTGKTYRSERMTEKRRFPVTSLTVITEEQATAVMLSAP